MSHLWEPAMQDGIPVHSNELLFLNSICWMMGRNFNGEKMPLMASKFFD